MPNALNSPHRCSIPSDRARQTTYKLDFGSNRTVFAQLNTAQVQSSIFSLKENISSCVKPAKHAINKDRILSPGKKRCSCKTRCNKHKALWTFHSREEIWKKYKTQVSLLRVPPASPSRLSFHLPNLTL